MSRLISTVIKYYRGPPVYGKCKIFSKNLSCMLWNPPMNCGTIFHNTLYIPFIAIYGALLAYFRRLKSILLRIWNITTISLACVCFTGMEYSYCTRTYSSTVFSVLWQLYSVRSENYEYKYSYLLEYWSKKPSTHENFSSTAEYFFILKLFYSRVTLKCPNI